MVRWTCVLLSLSLCAGNLSLLDVSSFEPLSADVVYKGLVREAWVLPGLESTRLIEKSSYQKFYVVYPAGNLQVTVSRLEGNSTVPGLYDRVPDKDTVAKNTITINLCDEYFLRREGLDAHFFYLDLHCLSRGKTTIRLTATDTNSTSKSVSWYLIKRCVKDFRGDIRLLVDGEQITKYGRVLPQWQTPNNRVDDITNVSLSVRLGNQKVEDIEVKTALAPHMWGMGAHGGLVSGLYTFFLSFDCEKGVSQANVTVRIAIPPYNSLQFSYIYDCPVCDSTNHSDHLPAINIGSHEGVFDIVKAGRPLSPYIQGQKVPSDQFLSAFNIHSVDQVRVDRVHITTNMCDLGRRVLQPEVDCEEKSAYQHCVLRFNCLGEGKAHVTITLPMRHLHQAIEFSYEKTCKTPKMIVTETVMIDSTLLVVIVTVVLIGIWACACWSGFKSPVPKSIELSSLK